MSRWEPIVPVFLIIALFWGFGTAYAVDVAGWNPILAPASAAVLVGIFGWLRRGRDILDVAFPSVIVAYAAYIGLALVRVSQSSLLSDQWRIAPLAERWPAVLFAGLPYALILTVAVALPMSLIPIRRHLDPRADERFWTFVKERSNRPGGL